MTKFRPKSEAEVAVRMYCQGFGDCFLVAYRQGNAIRHLVIDCGIHKNCPDKQERMAEVVDSIRQSTGGKIQALVITHEHYDHVIGFKLARPQWEAFTEIGEIWMSWTGKDDDPQVVALRDFGRKALEISRMALNHAGVESEQRLQIESVLAAAPEDVHEGYEAAKAIAASKGAEEKIFEPGKVEKRGDLEVIALGPPRGKLLAKLESKKEMYLAQLNLMAMSDFLGLDTSSPATYEERLRDALGLPRTKDAEDRNSPFDQRYRFTFSDERWPSIGGEPIPSRYRREAWRTIDEAWVAGASDLALHVDDLTNNTSFAFALKTKSGKVLLFVGDAQIGNWQSWELQDYRVESGLATISDLLGAVAFYKVGHHASHNATRKSSLAMMPQQNLISMIPVETGFYGTIPRGPLLDELGARGPVARMDKAAEAQAPFEPSAQISPFTGRPLYVDVHI
jgi:hypothetical protein